MKKLLSATLAVALVFGVSGAMAQTMNVSANLPGGPAGAVVDVPQGTTFEMRVSLDAAGEASSAAEFVMGELLLLAPGVFKLGTIKVNNTPLDLGDNAVGEYVMAFGTCVPGGAPVDLVVLNYGTFGGPVPVDTVIALRGLQPGDSVESTFNGDLGFIDCSDNGYVAQMGGTDGGVTGSGVEFPDGSLVINPTPLAVPTVDGSVGQLKAQF
jgi:hypothetical protein